MRILNTISAFDELICFSIIDSPRETAKEISAIFNCLTNAIKVFLLKAITIFVIDDNKAFNSFRHNFFILTLTIVSISVPLWVEEGDYSSPFA